MSFEITDRLGRLALARITGGCYLAFVAASVLANAWGHIGLGDAQQINDSISTTPGLFRLGLVTAYGSALLFLLAAWGLYLLLRPVNADLALLFLLLNAVGVAVQCASLLHLVHALLLGNASGTPGGSGVSAPVVIEVYRTGMVSAQVFFGAWLFPLGYLVHRSGFLPRTLGVLLLLDGVAEAVWVLQAFLLPGYPAVKLPGTVVSTVAEVGLALWLLIRGVQATGRGARLTAVDSGGAAGVPGR